ncbi:MAG: hypothetical protein AAFY60_09130, partial [Myxococcota bacterium]
MSIDGETSTLTVTGAVLAHELLGPDIDLANSEVKARSGARSVVIATQGHLNHARLEASEAGISLVTFDREDDVTTGAPLARLEKVERIEVQPPRRSEPVQIQSGKGLRRLEPEDCDDLPLHNWRGARNKREGDEAWSLGDLLRPELRGALAPVTLVGERGGRHVVAAEELTQHRALFRCVNGVCNAK